MEEQGLQTPLVGQEYEKRPGSYSKDEIVCEFKKQLYLAGPLMAVNLLVCALSMISVMFVGHLGELALSGASMATSFASVTGTSLMVGMGSALDTFCGQSYGAKEYHMLGIHMQRAMIVLLSACIPLAFIWANAGTLLVFLGQDPEISAEAGLYSKFMIPSLFGNALLQCHVRFLQSQNNVVPMMLSTGITTLLHILVCWIMVFKSGLGSRGAALANALSCWLNVSLLALYVRFAPACKKTWTGFSKEALHNIPTFLKLAVPSAIMVCLEIWSFEMMVLLSGLLPNPQLETSVLSISLNTCSMLYMIPLGLSSATSVRVSNELGAGRARAALLAIRVSMFAVITEGGYVVDGFQSVLSEFAMTDLGPLNYFLGISATRTTSGIFLSQTKYATEILEQAQMLNCNPCRTPIDTEKKLGPEGSPVTDPTLYRSLAGSLQYLTFTRPDLSYAVQQLCLYMHDPREPHLNAMKRVLRYLRGTTDLGLQLFRSTTSQLIAYSDADWAGCPATRRSTSGYCVFLGDNLLTWSSKRQDTLSRSSAEAEYRGVANAVAETSWIRNLLRELHTPLFTATLVYCDNVSVVYMSANPVQHQRTKHIEIDIHFVRDKVAAGHVRVLHVPSRYKRLAVINNNQAIIQYNSRNMVNFFFTNFSPEWNKANLHDLFVEVGEISDVYVARKLTKAGKRFGFAWFFRIGNLQALKKRLNRIKIGSFRLKANIAKFEKSVSMSKQGFKKERWVFDMASKSNHLTTHNHPSSTIHTGVHTATDGESFKIHSLVELESIWLSMNATYCKVIHIGGSKFSLEFENKQDVYTSTRNDFEKGVEDGVDMSNDDGSNLVGGGLGSNPDKANEPTTGHVNDGDTPTKDGSGESNGSYASTFPAKVAKRRIQNLQWTM
ncbi:DETOXIFICATION 16-like protein [Tanacetum coccineum]